MSTCPHCGLPTVVDLGGPRSPDCLRCYSEAGESPRIMVTCRICGNKRCPKANDHRNDCTRSNTTGQPGSAYP